MTVVCVVLLGLATLLRSRAPRVVILLAAIALIVSVLNVFDYVFDAVAPISLAQVTQMALITSVATSALAIANLGLLGPANPFAVLAGRSPSASLSRRLLVIVVVVPVLSLWLTQQGQRLGFYDTSFGISLRLSIVVTLGVVAILRAAGLAKSLETDRETVQFERDRFFELSLDMLSVVDSDGRFRRVNPAWEAVLGYPPAEMLGRPYLEFVHPDDLDRTVAAGQRLQVDGELRAGFENRYRNRDGSYRWLEWTSRAVPDRSVTFAVARDITDRRLAEDRRSKRVVQLERRNESLSDRVDHDPVTGLHNRRYFDAEVARLERRRTRQPIAGAAAVSVIIFDLDHFGDVNKRYGHQAGDAVLRTFSGLLAKRFRETDLVARYGGEEFVAVLEGATSAEAIAIAEGIRASWEAASTQIGPDTLISITVSAGCTQLEDGMSPLAGLAVADTWLSQAKRAGRNQVVGL